MLASCNSRVFSRRQNAMTLSHLSAQDPEMQLNLQHILGRPNIILPKPGDLVLLCAQRVSDAVFILVILGIVSHTHQGILNCNMHTTASLCSRF